LVIDAPNITDADDAKVQDALTKVKGVDARKSQAKKGEIHVKLDDKGGAKLTEIQAALKEAKLIK
jgi:copper chaperone CopZ